MKTLWLKEFRQCCYSRFASREVTGFSGVYTVASPLPFVTYPESVVED